MGINLFKTPQILGTDEVSTVVYKDNDIQIERIVSSGYTSPKNFYYNQDYDEWLTLLQGNATLGFKIGGNKDLIAGDTLCILARSKHRIESTSSTPPCIWLCVHKLHQ